MSSLPPITVSSLDIARLEAMLESPALRQLPAAHALGEELARANVVAPADMPADVVSMDSVVACLDENSGESRLLTLVYPQDADADQGKISVLAPVGSALLGLSVGQHIDWPAPGGRTLRLTVTGIQYQPEAAGAIPG
ncbi:nucleoside diphosphate kinase regulator [Lysobacter brunescens]|uniref:Nucleoside diphosphate kinase regulator n=1 Tax=Lysobacter brunescens TaxID=262323 RepID=A0ABW2YBV6_9GAMM